MAANVTPSKESFWKEDPFGIVRPEEYEVLGIDPTDIPPGTFAAQRHPPLLSSRFGGNAYGFGFFEIYDHLNPEDVRLFQSVSLDNPVQIRRHYRKINQIYKKIGLLIRFSNLGKPYYLIPVHLVSGSIANIRNKADEISKIIAFHRKKYLKESYRIGLLTHADDPILNDLTIRFKEHQFVIIDSPERLGSIRDVLDLIILPRDIYRTVLLEKLNRRSNLVLSRKQLEMHALYMMRKIYGILKTDGEVFIIANRQPLKTNQTATIRFRTVQEQRNFLLFTHFFKTRKRYLIRGNQLRVNVYDLERYLPGLYVEQEVIERLSEGKDLQRMTLEEINNLAYLNLPLDNEFTCDQQRVWPRLLSPYFDEIFLKPLIPDSVKEERKGRFAISDYSPGYMLICLAQKKPAPTTFSNLKKDIMESRLAGCPLPLIADYRDSFDYLIRTLTVLNNIKNNSYSGLPEIFMERLSEPIENRKRRYGALNEVLRLMSKIKRLERIRSYLNPEMIEGPKTKVLEHLEILPFFGFSYGELKEIFLIVLGHTAMGRILQGKMNEKELKPVSDLARTCEPQEALNMLRYCRLMSMAETVASRRADMNQAQLAELFDLFDSMVRLVINREMDWDRLLDEKISSMGGIHNKLIRKLLMMINHFEFLDNWAEFGAKGEMEKESLADYDDKKAKRIENVIELTRIIERFENKFLKDDPLQLPIVYRKFLNTEFHGTGHLFERLDSQLVFVLLWFAVNISRGQVINFNPILSDSKYSEIDSRVNKVREEAAAINRDYLDLATLNQFSEQLYENRSAFIINTGFQLKLNLEAQSVDITYIDMDRNIEQLEGLVGRFTGCKISEIPLAELEEMERFFSSLEDFYSSHQRLISFIDPDLRVPERQKQWFFKVRDLRQYLKSNLISAIFEPEDVYTDLERLFHYSPSILNLALPELTALRDLSLRGNIYLRAPVIDHILTSTRKVQALIRGELKEFQDVQALHKLAQREFGPMAAGIVGLSESQIEELRSLLGQIIPNPPLFNALIKSFIFQDLGLTPSLRDRYEREINRADQAQAGALFLKKEDISKRYNMEGEAEEALIFLIEHHDWIHHLVRGEFSLQALKEITDMGNKDFLNAFFVGSFIMFSALGEDLILEDLATRLFEVRRLCQMIIEGETSFEEHFKAVYRQKGRLFYILEEFQRKGLPQGTSPSEYMESWEGDESETKDFLKAGRMINSMERIFRLRGIRYVAFSDLASLIVKVPIKFIYQKRKYYGIGYATFERDLFEALRIYNCIQRLPEVVRHFILEQLVGDRVRIFGFENVSIYLNYENQIKLLLLILLGSKRFRKDGRPVSLNFLNMVGKIERRYEIVNDFLSNVSVEDVWDNGNRIDRLFKARTGLLLNRDENHSVLTADFVDRMNPSRKISRMETITDLDELKNYYHYSLQTLRKSPFHTDDYELQLEDAFNRRLGEITALMIGDAKERMEMLGDFREIHLFYTELMDRSLEIGFSEDQKHRLTDLYELRKDNLKREKLEEINGLINRMNDINELKEYWGNIKYYLFNNRQFIGKEFETLVAKNFDRAVQRIRDMSFQIHFMS